MARMVPDPMPSVLSDRPERRAEREVYEAARDQLDSSFTVYYGVQLLGHPRHRGAHDGEIDFLVVHPQYGLLVLEVKGGAIRRDGPPGRWLSIARGGRESSIKDPFQQAREGKYAVLEKLHDAPAWREPWIPLGHGAVFPASGRPDHPLSSDGPLEICVFAEDMVSFGEAIDRIYAYWQEAARKIDPFDQQALQTIDRILAPSFQLDERLATRLARDDARIDRLTERQMKTLDILAWNRRVRVSGGAGTGKTMLAMEKASRLAREGMRTLLTCFNVPLADRLGRVLEPHEHLTIRNFQRLCFEFATAAGLEPSAPPEEPALQHFFRDELPEMLGQAIDRLPELRFDAIVVDEAQDFAPSWWLPLQFCLTDPDHGILYVFEDDNQRLYERRDGVPEDLIPIPLYENLRNALPIHTAASRFYDGPAFEGHGPPGEPIQWVPVADATESKAMQRAVTRALHRLIREEQVPANEIAILTGSALDRSGLADDAQIGTYRWGRPGEVPPDGVVLESIHRFKGLESRVVILTGIDEVIDREDLLYVGLTRARTHLIVVAEEDTIATLRAVES